MLNITMAYVDVEAWSADHVVAWIRGLHKSLEKTNLQQLVKNRINGSRLMLQTPQDLIELIPTIKMEAFQAILTGISTLRYLKYCSNTETLQSLTLNLACQARYLYNQLIQAEHSPRLLPVSTKTATPEAPSRFDFAKVDSNMQINQSTKQRVSLETLDCVSNIVDKIQYVVNWLNLISGQQKFSNDFKCIVLRVAVELASTAQRDQFVEQPNDVLKKTSKFLADYCEWVVLAIDDADFIQPCWLDILSIKKKDEETDFGIRFQPISTASLIVDKVIFSSPAHRSGRIAVGDELIQVDYQTVVGWPITTVEEYIESYKNEVIFTIKKKPVLTIINPSVIVLKPYAIALKRLPSHTSDSLVSTQADSDLIESDHPDELEENLDTRDHDEMVHELPKEPKGPVYELKSRRRKELKRRVSISGSISDAIVDLSLADSLPIPSLEKSAGAISSTCERRTPTKISKETLTKSVSHDTAKLYLHTLSIDRKHLWLQQTSEGN